MGVCGEIVTGLHTVVLGDSAECPIPRLARGGRFRKRRFLTGVFILTDYVPGGAVIPSRLAVGDDSSQDGVSGAYINWGALPGGALHAAIPTRHGPRSWRVPLQHRLDNALHVIDVLKSWKEEQGLPDVDFREGRHNPACLNCAVGRACGRAHIFKPTVDGRQLGFAHASAVWENNGTACG